MDLRRKSFASLGLGLLTGGLFCWLLFSELGIQADSLLTGKTNPGIEHVLVVSVSSMTEDRYTLYYAPEGDAENWSAADLVLKPAGNLSLEQVLRFSLPDKPTTRLRLDLGTHADTLLIRRVALVSRQGNSCQWPGTDFSRIFPETGKNVSYGQSQGGALIIYTNGRFTDVRSTAFSLENECDQMNAVKPFQKISWLLLGAAVAGALGAIFWKFSYGGASLIDLGLAGSFGLVIILPLTALLFGLGNTVVNAENRSLAGAPPPPASLQDFASYSSSLADYFNDHFGWRNELIYWGNQFRVRVLKTSPVKGVVLGKEGWLFYTGDNALLDYQGLILFRKKDRAVFDQYLNDARSRLAAQHSEFAVVIAPDKQTIYPEYLPNSIRKVTDNTRLDQFLAFNQSHSKIQIIDLRSALLSSKTGAPLYYQTDTHWNFLAGFYSSQEIFKQLSAHFPALTPSRLSDYDLVLQSGPGKDLAKLMMMRWYFTETEVLLKPHKPVQARRADIGYRSPSANSISAFRVDDYRLPKAIIFHDSYGGYLMPYLSEHFQQVIYVWTYQLDWELIEREKPDIVILQFVERQIEKIVP